MSEFEDYLRLYRPVRAPARLRGEAAVRKPSSPRWTTSAVAALAAAVFGITLYGVLISPKAESPQEREARAVFGALEDAVGRAQSLRVRFSCQGVSTLDGESAPFSAAGSLLVKTGNKLNLSWTLHRGSESKDIRFVSNGTTMATSLLFEEDTPRHLTADILSGWVRLGVISSHGLRSLERDRMPKAVFTLGGFSVGAEENGVRTITYQVDSPDRPSQPTTMKIWYETASHRILKREVTNHVRRFTETYSECAFDQEIPDDAFRASKH